MEETQIIKAKKRLKCLSGLGTINNVWRARHTLGENICNRMTKEFTAAAAAKSLQSCLILCDPTDGSPPGSPVPGILQARTLEWVAISFSNAWKWKVKGKSLSCARLLKPHGLQPTRLLHPWDLPDKSTGVGCLCFLRFTTLNGYNLNGCIKV